MGVDRSKLVETLQTTRQEVDMHTQRVCPKRLCFVKVPENLEVGVSLQMGAITVFQDYNIAVTFTVN